MKITLAKVAQSRLCRKQYVPLNSSLVTAEGPAIGTVWFDKEHPDFEPMIVDEISPSINRVFYSSNMGVDALDAFLDYVRVGRYVLIGVVPAPASYTVT